MFWKNLAIALILRPRLNINTAAIASTIAKSVLSAYQSPAAAVAGSVVAPSTAPPVP